MWSTASGFQFARLSKQNVFVWKLACEDPVEKLYYSAKFEDMCVYCVLGPS